MLLLQNSQAGQSLQEYCVSASIRWSGLYVHVSLMLHIRFMITALRIHVLHSLSSDVPKILATYHVTYGGFFTCMVA
jgi:hypothetical protein